MWLDDDDLWAYLVALSSVEEEIVVPGWWARLFITAAKWEERIEKASIQGKAFGYITAINECTVERDIPDFSFSTKHYKWVQNGTTETLVESLKMYMYMQGMTTRTIRDHVAWKDAHK